MKLQGISKEGLKRIARKVAQDLPDDSWDMGGDPGDDRDDEWMPDAEELVLYIDNTYELYGQKQSIQKNLIRKLNKGSYDASLAPKLWGYLVQEGAKRYVQEMGESFQGMPWHKVFPTSIRQEAAQQMAADFEAEVDVAEDDLNTHFGV